MANPGYPELLQLGTVNLTPIVATDGTNGILLELQPHPGLGPRPVSRFAMTDAQALDLSRKLAAIVALPRGQEGRRGSVG